MKIACVTDVHVGARGNSRVVAEHQINFFKNVFIPFLRSNGITNIICLGDLFDVRSNTNHALLHLWRTEVFDRLVDFEVHLILGNHDSHFRNTLSVDTPSLVLGDYHNIKIYKKPTEVVFDGQTIGLVPWICAENEKESLQFLTDTRARVIMGHFDIQGFEMHKGSVSTDGLSRDTFKKFEVVYSGHFHRRGSDGRIHYIGNPYDLTWADYGDTRGFVVFDTGTLETEYVNNPDSLHVKFFYNDTGTSHDYFKQFDLSNVENKYVRVFVVKKADFAQYDKFLDRLHNIKLADLHIVEEVVDVSGAFMEDEEINVDDTMTMVRSYVDSVDLGTMIPERVKSMLNSLYLEAMNRG